MKTVTFLNEGLYVYPVEHDSGWDTLEVFAGEEIEVEDKEAQYLAKQYRESVVVVGMPASYYLDWFRDVEILEDVIEEVFLEPALTLRIAINLRSIHLEALRDGDVLSLYIGDGSFILLGLDDDR